MIRDWRALRQGGRIRRLLTILPRVVPIVLCAPLVTGCVPPSVVQYTAFHNRDFSARAKPAEVQHKATSELLNGGYLLIGYIDLRRNVRTCYEDGHCTDHSDKLPAPDALPREAAQRGGDVVTVLEERTVLEQHDQSYCRSWSTITTYVDRKPVTTTICVSWASIKGKLEARISRALIWRHEPEAARGEANARAIEAALKTLENASAPDATASAGDQSVFAGLTAAFPRNDGARAAGPDALTHRILAAIAADDSAALYRLARDENAKKWRDEKGRTALMVALLADRREAARTLLAIDPGLGQHDSGGYSAMQYAVARADLATVREFRNAGYDLHELAGNGLTLPYFALVNDRADVFDWLLDQGLDVRVRDPNGESLLHAAADYGRAGAVRRLLDLGLDVNDHGGRSRRSVLMAGARSGNPATVAVLLGAKARRDFTDDEGNTALHYAAFGGNRDVIRVLLRSGLSINRENKRGGSPLLMAMSREKWDAAAYFIDRGASLTTTAITPEKAAAQLILKNQPQLLRRYADAYPSLKELLQRDPEWIHYAARKSGRATIEYLAGIGARINRAGADGWTPLMSAADAGNAETVEALLAFKADPAARDRNNQTALMLATVRGQDKVVETLRNHGVTD